MPEQCKKSIESLFVEYNKAENSDDAFKYLHKLQGYVMALFEAEIISGEEINNYLERMISCMDYRTMALQES